MEALLALVVMTSIDHEPWRWLLGLSALPILVVILLFIVGDYNVICSTHYTYLLYAFAISVNLQYQ